MAHILDAVGNVEQFGRGLDRFAEADVGFDDEAALRRLQFDGGRWIAGLATFDFDQYVAFLNVVALEGVDIDCAAGDARRKHGAVGGDFLDAADGEHGGLEVALLYRLGFDAEIGDSGFVERDEIGVLIGVGVCAVEGTECDSSQNGDQC